MADSRLITRRAALLGALTSTTALAIPVAAALATVHTRPEDRLAAAVEEASAALAEMYPGWRVQVENRAVQPISINADGTTHKLPASKHGVLLYASAERFGREEPRWYVNYL